MWLLTILWACDDQLFTSGAGHEVVSTGDNAAVDLLHASCASCHGGGLAPNLSGDICADVVGVGSTQVPSMNFIEAEDPANSYLLLKLKGEGASVGGTSSVMPPSGMLPAEQIQIVEDWIAAGAICGSVTDTGTQDTGSTTDTSIEDTGTDTTNTEPDLDNGKTVHDTKCITCHTGGMFGLLEYSANMSDAALENQIQNGGGGMPGQNLSATDLRDLMAFLRQEYGGGQ